MLLKSLKLHNIRSYTEAFIEFPNGSILLAGDIGSGKTSILLAIEFALFGIKASELPASLLLRHGAREGSVELSLSLNGQDVIIKRNLKRGQNGISQDAGYIIVDGIKKDATPKELRAIIFELLGYPKELMGRSKDLVYRYTVYTPQEAMREILYAKSEERLDILRRVFNIDKYKRIKENSVILLGQMKERRKELEGFTMNLLEKKKERESIEADLKKAKEAYAILSPIVEQKKKESQAQRNILESLEKDLKDLNLLLRESASLDASQKAILEQHKRNTSLLAQIEAEMVQGKEELAKMHVEHVDERLRQVTSAIAQNEANIRQLIREWQSVLTKKEGSQEIIQKVSKLNDCPLCLQQVSHDHKTSIQANELQKQAKFEELLKEHKEREQKISADIAILKKEEDDLRKKQQLVSIRKLKEQQLAKKEQDKGDLQKYLVQLKAQLGDISQRRIAVQEKLPSLNGAQERYDMAKKAFDVMVFEERKIELECVAAKKGIEGLERLQQVLEKDIKEKEVAEVRLKKLREMHEWISQFFMNLMGTMERHVMQQINSEFNELFKNWFSILLEDESMSVRLDDQFAVIVEQNGFETGIDNLSGGEKTAVALAYRLALNKVINDVVSTIKTKDIVILDEPTDGFSTEQLDRMREVLDLMNLKQVLIVSHEPKIESFVDKVIRVGKQGHVSRASF